MTAHWQIFDWVVLSIFAGASVGLGWWLARAFLGLCGFAFKVADITDALHDRVRAMRARRPPE